MNYEQLHHRIVIVYDSTKNSVFESQVLMPLKQWLMSHASHRATIISYEKTIHSHTTTLDGVSCIYIQRTRYGTLIDLIYGIYQLKQILKKYASYHLIARGPFAGYIAQKAATAACTHTVIQARGLAAEEYRFTHQTQGAPLTLYQRCRYLALHFFERYVYGSQAHNAQIEAVSTSLKNYLIHAYKASPNSMSIAHIDIPPLLTENERLLHRATVRRHLNLEDATYIYCYNGSYKPWQCPEETVLFFKQMQSAHAQTHLLILSPNAQQFQDLCSQHLLKEQYTIRTIQAHEVIAYTAACDAGILFRIPDIVNKSSRPTKMLEYYAAGCTIIHNNTIDAIEQIDQSRVLYAQLPNKKKLIVN